MPSLVTKPLVVIDVIYARARVTCYGCISYGRQLRERDLQGKGPSSILAGGFLFYSRDTSNNSEVFQ